MPGKREEHRGLLKYGARFCFAMQTVVPRLSVIIRKAYGAAAFLMMQTRAQGGDLVLALKEAQIGAMGQKASAKVRAAEHNKSAQDIYNESLAQAFNKGLVDEIIAYEDIRHQLAFHLRLLLNKKQKMRLPRKHFIEP
jgi:acetyl-CoA carboxylase carboxyltransferase component